MEKQAALNTMKYMGCVIRAIVQFPGKTVTDATKDVTDKGYKIVDADSTSNEFTLEFKVPSTDSGTAKSIAQQKLSSDFSTESVSRNGETRVRNQYKLLSADARFIFEVEYNYSGTDGVNIQTILEKVDAEEDLFKSFTAQEVDDGYAQVITVDAPSSSQAEYMLGKVLTQTHTFSGGRTRRLEVSDDMTKYLQDHAENARISMDKDSVMAYLVWAHKHYLEGMQSKLQEGLPQMAGVFSGLDSVDTPERASKYISGALIPGLNSLSAASWFKFRAERIERKITSMLIDDELDSSNLRSVQNTKNFDSLDDASKNTIIEEATASLKSAIKDAIETGAPLQPIISEYVNEEGISGLQEALLDIYSEQPTVSGMFKHWYTEKPNTDKVDSTPGILQSIPLTRATKALLPAIREARGVSKKGAKQLPPAVKDAVLAQIRKDTTLSPEVLFELSEAVTGFEEQTNYEKRDVENLIQESKGETPYQSEFESRVDYVGKVKAGELAYFMEIPLEAVKNKNQLSSLVSQYKQQLAHLRVYVDRIANLPESTKRLVMSLLSKPKDEIIDPEQKELFSEYVAPFTDALNSEFSGETPKRVLTNLPKWEEYVESFANKGETAGTEYLEDTSSKSTKELLEDLISENKNVIPMKEDPKYSKFVPLLNLTVEEFNKLTDEQQEQKADAFALLDTHIRHAVGETLDGKTYRDLISSKTTDKQRNEAAKQLAHWKELATKMKELGISSTFSSNKSPKNKVSNAVVENLLSKAQSLLQDVYIALSTDTTVATLKEYLKSLKKEYTLLKFFANSENSKEVLSLLQEIKDAYAELASDIADNIDVEKSEKTEFEHTVPEDTIQDSTDMDSEPSNAKDGVDYGELHTREDK